MLIVSDASPLIALAACDKLNVLNELFDRVCIPQAVFDELAVPNKPFAENIITWTKDKVVPAQNRTAITALSLSLDPGESEAISLYWEISADFLLIDEKRGRTIAHRNGIQTIGTVGVLLFAKQQGLIPSVKPLLQTLTHNGFRISDVLYQQILKRAEEE
ncbi:MAG: DUF3368 domain-containing protein [Spirochaetaceae bacterium]|jgi:predicted nucleic acid-binding protein|nr:DUF3368 domain-containing protein [Spirochaetaceae bacterium]